jgi:uncharacterized protein
MVIDPENDFDCINEICIEGAELERFSIQPSVVEFDYDTREKTYSEEYRWKYEYQVFLSLLYRFGRFPESETSPLANAAATKAASDYNMVARAANRNSKAAPSGPCIPGMFRNFVNVSGRIFPCERVSESSPATCMGSLDSGYDLSRVSAILNVGQLTEVECKKCWCFYLCSMCVKHADTGLECLSAEAKLKLCNNVRLSSYATLYRCLLFREIPQFYAKQVRAVIPGGDI